jgi:hypothetical protein
MKKINVLLICATVFLCGCDKSNTDNAKIESLSQKLDLVLQNQSTTTSNQTVIFNEVEALKTKAEANSQMALYYYTNQVNAQIFCASNVIGALASDEQKSVDAINSETRQVAEMNTIMILTNDNVIDMESDIEKIKIKLGIQ